MSLGGTASYHDTDHLVPARVRTAVAAAEQLDFMYCVRPEIGTLLAVLAGGLPAGARVGETGTGTGAGLAWMVEAAGPGVSFVSIEQNPRQVIAAREVFADRPEVEIIEGDSSTIADHGPFDLLVVDGGPGSGKGGDSPIDPGAALVPGGTLTVDDFTPMTSWPPRHNGAIDEPRVHWLDHPDLHSTEIRVAPDLAVLVCRRADPS